MPEMMLAAAKAAVDEKRILNGGVVDGNLRELK